MTQRDERLDADTFEFILVLVSVLAEREEKFAHCESTIRQNIYTSPKHQFLMNSFSKLEIRGVYRQRQAWRTSGDAETVRSDNVL